MRMRYKQAAPYIGCPEGTLRSLVHAGKVPHIRLGKRMVIFDSEQLDAWLAERTVQPPKAP